MVGPVSLFTMEDKKLDPLDFVECSSWKIKEEIPDDYVDVCGDDDNNVAEIEANPGSCSPQDDNRCSDSIKDEKDSSLFIEKIYSLKDNKVAEISPVQIFKKCQFEYEEISVKDVTVLSNVPPATAPRSILEEPINVNNQHHNFPNSDLPLSSKGVTKVYRKKPFYKKLALLESKIKKSLQKQIKLPEQNVFLLKQQTLPGPKRKESFNTQMSSLKCEMKESLLKQVNLPEHEQKTFLHKQLNLSDQEQKVVSPREVKLPNQNKYLQKQLDLRGPKTKHSFCKYKNLLKSELRESFLKQLTLPEPEQNKFLHKQINLQKEDKISLHKQLMLSEQNKSPRESPNLPEPSSAVLSSGHLLQKRPRKCYQQWNWNKYFKTLGYVQLTDSEDEEIVKRKPSIPLCHLKRDKNNVASRKSRQKHKLEYVQPTDSEDEEIVEEKPTIPLCHLKGAENDESSMKSRRKHNLLHVQLTDSKDEEIVKEKPTIPLCHSKRFENDKSSMKLRQKHDLKCLQYTDSEDEEIVKKKPTVPLCRLKRVRNNEASKKSRMKRKLLQQLKEQELDNLILINERLRKKADKIKTVLNELISLLKNNFCKKADIVNSEDNNNAMLCNS